ncbi:hypothetical protein G6011_06142 [Alternaria panax]|uniref:DUF6604 domain-containing protein n=1 Tax=Alternaria panax TaxID=48097 RepID=A0AAD4FKW2_9PLEO|nr:hypothetical protein G6011_06142 [Alternaria panax]
MRRDGTRPRTCEADNAPLTGKNKKNNSSNKKVNNGGGGGKQHLIRVSDFVSMAETTANNKESVLVPVALFWFEARAVQNGADSNKRHHHSITVLEDAFRLLQPFISSDPQATKIGGKCVASETLAMGNRVARLSLEEVAKLEDDEALDEMQLLVVTLILLKQDETGIEEELKFAIGLFFDELRNMPFSNQHSGTEEDKYWSGGTFWPTYLGLKYYSDGISKWNPAKNLPAIVPKDSGDRQSDDYTLRAIEFAQITRISMFGERPAVKEMHFQTLEYTFNSEEIAIWAASAVELLYQAQDTLGNTRYHPFVELALHLQKLVVQNNRMLKDWESTFLPSSTYARYKFSGSDRKV